MWNRLWIFGWIAILTVLAFYEFWAGFGPTKNTPMLTQVTVKFIPWWVTIPFLTWLLIHFSLRYANPAYIRSLDTIHQITGAPL